MLALQKFATPKDVAALLCLTSIIADVPYAGYDAYLVLCNVPSYSVRFFFFSAV